MSEILNAFLENPLWLLILTIISGFGVWLGYNSAKLKKKYPIKEHIDLKVRGNLITYVFLFLFVVGAIGLVITIYTLYLH